MANIEGWTEEELRNKDLRAPCGIFCGACAIYLATRSGSEKFKSGIAGLWGIKPQDVNCRGCMQPDPPKALFGFCRNCAVRNCARSKGLYSCHQCGEWPCPEMTKGNYINAVPSSVRASIRRVWNRSIPLWRGKVAAHGDEAGSYEWAKGECERYHCPSCGRPLFRSAQECRACRRTVAEELDGIVS
jgi:hypothetical protein